MPTPVHLHVYDLSGGTARSLSPILLGRQIDGVWHSAVVVAQKEYYFGQGISVARAGATRFGTPDQVIHLGDTHLDPADLPALIDDLRSTYHAGAYRLLGKAAGGLNCNDFADDLAKLLTGRGVPPHITSLPADVLATPFGAAIAPMLGGVEAAMGGMAEQGAEAEAEGRLQQPPAQPAVAEGLEAAAGAAALADAAAAAETAAGSPPAAAALAAEVAAPTLAAAEAAVADAAAGAHPAAARAAFEALVRREFDAALATGAAATPNEAAQVALERAAAAVRSRAG